MILLTLKYLVKKKKKKKNKRRKKEKKKKPNPTHGFQTLPWESCNMEIDSFGCLNRLRHPSLATISGSRVFGDDT